MAYFVAGGSYVFEFWCCLVFRIPHIASGCLLNSIGPDLE